MAVTASWNGSEIARSDATVEVEGNHYFPMADVRGGVLVPTEKTTHCSWKGDASYYSLAVDGAVNTDAAWCYPSPKEAAAQIKDRIAFWKGVTVTAA